MYVCKTCNKKFYKPKRNNKRGYFCPHCSALEFDYIFVRGELFGKELRVKVLEIMAKHGGSTTIQKLEEEIGSRASPSAIKYAIRVMGERGTLTKHHHLLDMRKVIYCLNDS